MLDLSKTMSDTYTFNLVMPDGTKRDDVSITVRSDSDPAVKAVNKQVRQQYSIWNARNKRSGRKEEDIEVESSDFFEELVMKKTIARIASASGFSVDKKELSPTDPEFKEMLTKHTWIAEQIEETAKDLVNFCAR